jgi:hypothetical protein
MNYARILAIDPSGNFEEGKGTTGTCLFDTILNKIEHLQDIHASAYTTKEQYWQAHLDFIKLVVEDYPETIIVIEDFTLDPRRAMQQSHSKMETPKIIGIIQLYCQQHDLPYKMQRAVEVKNRWADKILEYKGYIVKKNKMYYTPMHTKPISRHCKDAIRHAVHYATFYNKEN